MEMSEWKIQWKKRAEISQMEIDLNICGFLLHKIGIADIEGS